MIGASSNCEHVPAEADLVGPIGRPALRRLACDAIITRVITTEQAEKPLPRGYLDALPPPLRGPSHVLDVGRSARTATAAIRKALAARDNGCVMPGCGRPPPRCEAHHITHWSDGGDTAVSNMVLLICAFHHHYLHEHNWHIDLHPDGTVTVTPPPAQVA